MKAIETIERTDRSRQLIDDAATLADDVSDDSQLVGFVILAAYSDGTTRSTGYRPNASDHKIGSAMWQAWMRSALEDSFAYGRGVDATYDVLNGDA